MKIVYRLRFILLSVSVMFTCICFACFSAASLPYPDATQALLAQQRIQIDFWHTWLMIGCCAMMLSIVFLIVMSIIKRKNGQ